VAQPRIPSIDELLAGDADSYLAKIAKLPAPLVAEVEKQLKQLYSRIGAHSDIPSTPIEMAIRNPRYRWMDTPHFRFLGEKAAESIEFLEPTIVSMPPRCGKSTTLSQWTPFWALAKNPELSILFVSYETNFARRWGLKTRQLVELHGHEYGLKLNPRQTAADNWELESGGGMSTVGVGGGIGGKPAKLFILDDLLKDQEEARSTVQRENAWEWWQMTAMQRIEPDTAVFAIGTRWNEDDILARMISASKSGAGPRFNVISLPALAEENDPIGRAVGDPLWPERFSKAWWEARRSNVSDYVWSAVYQQRPTPPRGNIIDPAWWRYYRLSELPGEFDQIIQSWDLALDAQKRTDSYHCGGVLARKGALVFLLAAFHEHCDINKVMSQILDWNQLYPKARTKLIERAISGPAVVQMLQHQVSGMTPWPPKGTRKDSKEGCLHAILPDIRSGNVLLPLNYDGSRPKWVDDMTGEVSSFPHAPHDDWVDMLSMGVAFLLPSARRAISDAHAEALALKRPETSEQEHARSLHSIISKVAKPRMDAMRKLQARDDASPFPTSTIDSSKLRSGRGVRKVW
jgi:hypothetical protein